MVIERTLPLTGRACLDRIITDLAVINVTSTGLLLVELVLGVTVDVIIAATDAPLEIAV